MRANTHPFIVTIQAHDVPPRWSIPASEKVVFAVDGRLARKHALQSAHRDAGVPPLRSLLRVSWRHTEVKPAPEEEP